MVKINAHSDIEDVKNRIGVGPDEELRTSSMRQSHLERYARIMTMNPKLRLFFHSNRTDINMEGENPVIRVTDREFEQHATNLDKKVFDLVMQETLTDHEVGHDLYSDWPSIIEMRERLEDYIVNGPKFQKQSESDRKKLYQSYEGMFHTTWNAIEDGCIERALWNEFYNREEFEILHANIIEDVQYGEVDKLKVDGKYEEFEFFSMYSAILAALMDKGYYDSGTTDKLLDPDEENVCFLSPKDVPRFEAFMPEIEKVIADTHKEGNAVKRNEMVYDFFIKMIDVIESASFSGKDVSHMKNTTPIEDLPDDFHEGIGEARMDGDMDGEGGGSVAIDIEEGGAGERQEESLKRELNEAVGDKKIEEIEKLMDTLGRLGGEGDNSMEIHLPDPEDGRDDIWREGVAIGQRILPILRDRLRIVERDRIVRKKRRGHLDTRQMINASRGSIDVFKQNVEGKKKKYQCVILVDKSGSMHGDVDDAELSVIGYTWALEKLGIETMVMDIYQGNKRLLKPFGVNPAGEKDHLSSGRTGGGTPLASAVKLARNHVDNSGDDTRPFIIVITDGEASNMSEYRAELSACTFPVFGVYIRNDITRSNSVGQDRIVSMGETLDWFNRWELVASEESVADALLRLSYSIIL